MRQKIGEIISQLHENVFSDSSENQNLTGCFWRTYCIFYIKTHVLMQI